MGHYSCGNFGFRRGERQLLPATLLRSERPALPFSCFSRPATAVLLARMLSSVLLLSLTLLCTGFSCERRFLLRTCTCACEIAGVTPLSSFSCTLPNPASTRATSSRRLVLASHNLPRVIEGLAGTIRNSTLYSLHVFFLYVYLYCQ